MFLSAFGRSVRKQVVNVLDARALPLRSEISSGRDRRDPNPREAPRGASGGSQLPFLDLSPLVFAPSVKGEDVEPTKKKVSLRA